MARYMRALERAGRLNRAIEYLPDDETIVERQGKGLGLTRPELAVLLSYAKITLYDELLSSDLPDDPYMTRDLLRYFPRPLRKHHAEAIQRHRLRREIVATKITNDMINRVGITFVHEVREKSGMAVADIARAYMISREILDMRAVYREIEAQDNKVSAALQASALAECGRLSERTTVWFLRQGGHPLDIETQVEGYAAEVARLAEALPDILPPDDLAQFERAAARYCEQGMPEGLSRRLASFGYLAPACDIVAIAQRAARPVLEVGKAYFTVGHRFGFDWLRRAAATLPSDSAWDKLAVTAMVDDLYGEQSVLTDHVVNGEGNLEAAETMIDHWAEQRRPQVARAEQLLAELQTVGNLDLAMLAVANRQLRSLVDG
jgi:glutamate dehydrogenase